MVQMPAEANITVRLQSLTVLSLTSLRFRYNSAMKRILLMVVLLSVPLCAPTPEAKFTPAAPQSITISKLPPGR
jgi:hypothetical protein